MWVDRNWEIFWLKSKAKKLRRDCEAKPSLTEVVDLVRLDRRFSLIQKRREILDFCKLVDALKPKIICDIGSSGGGTIRLFSHFGDVHARIFSVDIDNAPRRQKAFAALLKPSQSIRVYRGSSYDPKTVEEFKAWLDTEKIDLLFIDGDHEYEGVSRDFNLYSPFVRKGGLIGFHDIVEDYKTRHGRETPAYVGEVPRFWRELKEKYPQTQELIQDPEQDGYGIGVIQW